MRNLQKYDFNPNIDSQARQCHDYLKTYMTAEPFDLHGIQASDPFAWWPPVDHLGDVITGYSNCYAVKVRELFFPEIDDTDRLSMMDTWNPSS